MLLTIAKIGSEKKPFIIRHDFFLPRQEHVELKRIFECPVALAFQKTHSHTSLLNVLKHSRCSGAPLKRRSASQKTTIYIFIIVTT
jgi:hypothetical protein